MPRIGFFCDDCGLLWATERKNNIDGKTFCDDCAEGKEETEHNHPLSGGYAGPAYGGHRAP